MKKKTPAILVAVGFALLSLLFSLLAMGAIGAVFALTGAPRLPQSLGIAAGVSGPALAAILLTLLRGETRALLANITSGLPPLWILAVPVLFATASWIAALASGGDVVSRSGAALASSLAFHVLAISLLEETGWRGYLTPRLLGLASPLGASMCVSLVWFAWHAPKFSIGWDYTIGAAVACVGLSILATALLSLKRGGFAACVILHASANSSQVLLDTARTSHTAQIWAFLATSALALTLAAIVIRRLGPGLGHQASD